MAFETLTPLPMQRNFSGACPSSMIYRTNSRVADLACGLGFDLLRLHRRVPDGHVVGFDISHDLVVAARQYISGHDNVEVIQADACHLDYQENYFYAVRIDRALQHINDTHAVVAEMARVTKSGGYVSASEPDWSSFRIAADCQVVMQIALNEWMASFNNPFVGIKYCRYNIKTWARHMPSFCGNYLLKKLVRCRHGF